jgi:phage terminase large subunit-like protein
VARRGDEDTPKRGRGRPTKSLNELIRDGTFEGRRSHHRDLLVDEPLVENKTLRKLQQEYRRAEHELERHRVAREFEASVRRIAARRERRRGDDLAEFLASLGPRATAERIINLFARVLRLDNGEPWILDDWQEEHLEDLYERDDEGRRVYKVALLGVPRGLAKTPLAVGVGIDAVLDPPPGIKPNIFQGSGSKDQAAIGLEYADFWINGDDEHPPSVLARWLRTKADRIIGPRGSFRILSSEGKLSYGRKPLLGILDELWLFKHLAHRKLFTGLRTAMHKIQDSFLYLLSTGGDDPEGLLAEIVEAAMQSPHKEVRNDGCLTIVRDRESGFLMWWFGAPADIDPLKLSPEELEALVRRCNPGSWVDVREIIRELHSPDCDVFEWRRMHLNQILAGGVDTWIPSNLWAAGNSRAHIPDGAEITVGVDAAITHDTTAAAWAYRRPDGKVVVRSEVWAARQQAPHDRFVVGGRIDLDLVERFVLEELAPRYRIKALLYDPTFFEPVAMRLANRGLTVVPMYPNGKEMQQAAQQFYIAVKEGRLLHDPKDTVLDRHVAAAKAVQTKGGWKLDKRGESEPNDALIASVMAHLPAAGVKEESVYERRDLLVLGESDDEQQGELDLEAVKERYRQQVMRDADDEFDGEDEWDEDD